MKYYFVKFKMYEHNDGAFKYGINPKYEIKTHLYNFEDKPEVIKNYIRMKKDDMVYEDVEVFGIDLDKVSIQKLDMQKIIEDYKNSF